MSAKLAYGEDQPRLSDDSAPAMLIVLDGLGDRAHESLDGQTPSEAASTPTLDEFVRRGSSGVHLPFGPGRAPSSEHAHWALFGYEPTTFPGRAILEAAGAGFQIEPGALYVYAALRPSHREPDGTTRIVGRACAGADDEDCERLYSALNGFLDDTYRFSFHPLRRGEAIVKIHGPVSRQVTDTDPLFEERHPMMQPLPTLNLPRRPLP